MLRAARLSAKTVATARSLTFKTFGLRLQSSIPSKPKEHFTRLTEENDPQRDAFFRYTWGSWLQDDKAQKQKRVTRFSIEGTTAVVNGLYSAATTGAKVLPPLKNLDNSVTLTHNLTEALIGTKSDAGMQVQSMASVHEGKHHRIYKVTASNGRDFVLRIPYPLDTDFATAMKIKSEVATLDFLDLKLGLNVPKVFSYGADASNPLQTPYILMEYLPGDLLMKQWAPLVSDADAGEGKEILKKVVDPLSEFQAKLLSVDFSKFGSLYFKDDVSVDLQKDAAYEGETDTALADRWKVGPTVERAYSKDRGHMTSSQLEGLLGPWDKSKPLELVKSVSDLELESLRTRIGLSNADSANKVEDTERLARMVDTYTKLGAMAPQLFNTASPAIPNVQDLFKPRFSHPDLDPMNVIMKPTGETTTPYFVDFENVSIKPFILQNNPQFIIYEGPKIYDLEADVENYAQLDEAEQQQYDFMYHRTRNQHLWEAGLNERAKHLISSVAPPVKLLRSPYVQAVDRKGDQEYLYVEAAMIQLEQIWDMYAQNKLVNSDEFPVKFSSEEVEAHAAALQAFQEEIVGTPFAATKGWVPQDMFDRLREQGIIVEDGENFKLDVDKALEEDSQE
ncbi:hypothetical protein BABINDRAFT_39356 [Babjeviella inositovora NRRL Y-12698]|uniref:Altered inheritance of mitochondria protein 9, mitochondrial n=1 Tax=Babjeviella inositovora NRRL Y-12698 TaxID=984486 RepID=A0A1E3QLP6_9ASCO|nr:uncharacterized protein BABINDRAFT_39356 [Babjeviella inositovora NRRL Y-12698]ODQ78613.1 hypothetical protein BABINDRAFT_39356 [Babjeviella inositovora NRRL Y-12698]